jgi:glutamyl-Q tRNA(Asp) synthetase
LSKQNHAPAIDNSNPKPALLDAMRFLGFEISRDIEQANLAEIIAWGVSQWRLEQLPGSIEITPRFSNRSL